MVHVGSERDRVAEAAYKPIKFHPDWLQDIIKVRGNPVLYPTIIARTLIDGWWCYAWQWKVPGNHYTLQYAVRGNPRRPIVRVRLSSHLGPETQYTCRANILTRGVMAKLLDVTQFLEVINDRTRASVVQD